MRAWHGERSPTRSGSGFGRICLVRSATRGAGGRAPTRAAVSRASSGCSGRARRGVNCRRGTAVPQPAGVACASGRRAASSWASGAPSSTNSTTGSRSAGTNVSWMVVSPRPKRGRPNRPHQARQGHEVDGTGRWRGYSAGSIPGRGVPGGGHAPGSNARESAHPGEARAVDRRPRLRPQCGPPLPQAPGHSAHHSRPPQQPAGHRPRRAVSAALSTPLDRRAHDRVARQLPPADGAL